jgi:CSLREA domain-containing protein
MMVSRNPATRPAGFEFRNDGATAAVCGVQPLLTVPAVLKTAIVAALALTLVASAARAATITVTTLSDPAGPSGTCSLRDAITAANTMTATNGCAAGSGNDTINFSVTGTIALANTLPAIIDKTLTIIGPMSPGITLDGDNKVQVMTVASASTLNLKRLTIANGQGGLSGGIFNDGKLTVTNTTFSGNIAGYGAGIFNYGTLTLSHSTFSGNSAGAYGGGIYNNGDANLINSSFSGNTADSGGAIEDGFATLTITNSTFSANRAARFGGGIDTAGTLTVTNSTFSGNSANLGGGIYKEVGGTLSVTNSTFSGNSSTSTIGAGAAYYGVGGIFKATIIANSTGSNCGGHPNVDAGYNISDTLACGFSKTGSANNGVHVNPRLSTAGLANNGGPTQTIALQPDSPAIDAIPLGDCTDQASPPNPIITDQRLFPRPDIGEVACDIGAYEVQDTAFVPFAGFGGGLTLHPGAGLFYLSGGFKLGPGGSIDPATEPVAFSVGNYALRLPAGSFVKNNTGYVYQKTVNGIFLFVYIKFTSTPGIYRLLVERKGGPLPTNPAPVTLTIGNDSGSTFFK